MRVIRQFALASLVGLSLSTGCTSGAPLTEVIPPEFRAWAAARGDGGAWLGKRSGLLRPVDLDRALIRLAGWGCWAHEVREVDAETLEFVIRVGIQGGSTPSDALGAKAVHYVVLELPAKARPYLEQDRSKAFRGAKEVARGVIAPPKGSIFRTRIKVPWSQQRQKTSLWVSALIEAEPGILFCLGPISVR